MRCVLFDLLESESHDKLNISAVYSAIIEPERFSFLFFFLPFPCCIDSKK